MHAIDLGILTAYALSLLGMGFYFLKKNRSTEDFFVSDRKMSSWHIGLSVVATDVGGGFSIGLGGLGFVMGLSGSWMLFTGLIGAWISAVILIPKVYKIGSDKKLTTFPQLFNHYFNGKVALIAGIISAIGYLGFTSSQILAGAKLAAASFEGLDIQSALLIMGIVTILYTVMGGMTAVIYTDTVQWIVLMAGLFFVGIPISYEAIGGWDAIKNSVGPEFLSMGNLSWQTMVNWAITIIPIWFVGMTLYQRIYASKSEKEAKKAWFIAGLFEWPVMAFMGVLLGLFGRVAADQGMFASLGFASAAGLDPELGMPLLLRQILPVGFMGLVMAAYFSAILSTADSCLMAASGNLLTDILIKIFPSLEEHPRVLQYAQMLTLLLGMLAILLASRMENVLGLMLYSYAFMVSGLLVPLIAAMFFNQSNSAAAIGSMIAGGCTTVILTSFQTPLPFGLDANIFGITASLIVFISFTLIFKSKANTMEYVWVNPQTGESKEYKNDKIAGFLFENLDQFGDKREYIMKAIEYALDKERGGMILLDTDAGKITGAVVINRTGMDGYIPSNILVYIAVAKEQRGKGTGKKLMLEVMKKTMGGIALHVEPDNPAKQLYERLGFTNKYLEMRYLPEEEK